MTLLLNPTDKIPIILICDGVFLLGLGLVIIVFHMYEKVSESDSVILKVLTIVLPCAIGRRRKREE